MLLLQPHPESLFPESFLDPIPKSTKLSQPESRAEYLISPSPSKTFSNETADHHFLRCVGVLDLDIYLPLYFYSFMAQ